MSFQTPLTIAEGLEKSEQHRYLLPAIQRELELTSNMAWLFDSLMRG